MAGEWVQRDALQAELEGVRKVIEGMVPRVKAVERALAARGRSPEELAELFRGVQTRERQYTEELARIFENRTQYVQPAQIIVQQFQVAQRAFAAANSALGQLLATDQEAALIADFSLARFKGEVYHLYNFYMAFRGEPKLETLFEFILPPTNARPPIPPRKTAALPPPKTATLELPQAVAPVLAALQKGLGLVARFKRNERSPEGP